MPEPQVTVCSDMPTIPAAPSPTDSDDSDNDTIDSNSSEEEDISLHAQDNAKEEVRDISIDLLSPD